MHVRMKTFAMFQQNYLIKLKMADNLGVCVLLVKRVFSGSLTYTLVFSTKQHNLDANSLQFVCIKTNLSVQIIKIGLSWAYVYMFYYY